jgi:hypothetical protein
MATLDQPLFGNSSLIGRHFSARKAAQIHAIASSLT